MITILVIISIVLAVLAVVQLVRVFESTAKLQGGTSPVPTDSENRYQAKMMLVFMFAYFSFFAWLYARYGDKLLPESASEHGVGLDTLLGFNFAVISLVMVITHIFLFYFAYKYVYNKDRKALYFTHSSKLEMIWTVIPAIFLAVIVIYGLSAWIDMTIKDAPKDSIQIELYPKQFDWTARYSGSDSTLGASNYNMISTTNPLGVITDASIEMSLAEMKDDITSLEAELETVPKGGVKDEEITELIAKRKRQVAKIKSFSGLDVASLAGGKDDILVKSEFYIPVGKEVNFQFRSRDVIHSAYMPHFRAQMNCVPGMTTQFHFKPTITTDEMRSKTQNDEFDYILLCNKICGAAHYNMKMTIKVVSEEDYYKWLSEQETFAQSIAPEDADMVLESNELKGNEISMIEQ
jgi:cytochrome c oxidase subunit 2